MLLVLSYGGDMKVKREIIRHSHNFIVTTKAGMLSLPSFFLREVATSLVFLSGSDHAGLAVILCCKLSSGVR